MDCIFYWNLNARVDRPHEDDAVQQIPGSKLMILREKSSSSEGVLCFVLLCRSKLVFGLHTSSVFTTKRGHNARSKVHGGTMQSG